MDELSEFLRKIELEIEEITPGSLQAETSYRQLPEWSSMHALILIAISETEYDVTITGEDLRKCETFGDLYSLIKSRK